MTEQQAVVTARKTWRTLEPLHGMIYFVPEAAEEYNSLGLTGRDGYFASRAAPMGAVAADVVVATFYNFNPELVRHAIPAAWDRTTPEELIAARFRAVDRSYRRLLGDAVLASTEMREAAGLARRCADVAKGSIEGRPLCAGHTRIPWTDVAHLDLWLAQAILREYRGDGHLAQLVSHGLSGVEALVTHAAEGLVPAGVLQSTRGWSDDVWRDAVAGLRTRGWLEGTAEPTFTEWGAAQRSVIEAGTDDLAAGPYAAVGADDCALLRTLARPWSKLVAEIFQRPPS